MDIPEDVARILDSERFKLAASYVRMAVTALDNAGRALNDMPSGRDARDTGMRTADPSALDVMHDDLNVLADRLDSSARHQ
jgi:hypothetical protein